MRPELAYMPPQTVLQLQAPPTSHTQPHRVPPPTTRRLYKLTKVFSGAGGSAEVREGPLSVAEEAKTKAASFQVCVGGGGRGGGIMAGQRRSRQRRRAGRHGQYTYMPCHHGSNCLRMATHIASSRLRHPFPSLPPPNPAPQEHLPLIAAICNPGLRERHWEALAEVVGFEVKRDEVTSLKRLLDHDVATHLAK